VRIRSAPPENSFSTINLLTSRCKPHSLTWEHLGTKPARDPRSLCGAFPPPRACRPERGFHTSVPELLLGDLDRHAEVVQDRGMHVAKLMRSGSAASRRPSSPVRTKSRL